MHDLLMIDGLQYSNWSPEIFQQMQAGGLSAVHATIAYHETARETLSRLGEWNRRFESWPDLIRPVRSASDIRLAHQEGRVGIFFGFQNCSPIEDDIALVEVFRQLGVFVMQLTYNNQSLLASGCYEREDNGISRFGRQVIAEMNRVGMLIDMSHSAERSTLEAGADKEMQLGIARNIQRCHAALLEYLDAHPGDLTAHFLITQPAFKGTVRRLQGMAQCAYGEIRANLLARDMLPIHLLRCKLAFFGAGKFDPKSSRWVRITLFQGAPLVSEIGQPFADDWNFAVMPNGAQ